MKPKYKKSSIKRTPIYQSTYFTILAKELGQKIAKRVYRERLYITLK